MNYCLSSLLTRGANKDKLKLGLVWGGYDILMWSEMIENILTNVSDIDNDL
jgi:hypothetical protein